MKQRIMKIECQLSSNIVYLKQTEYYTIAISFPIKKKIKWLVTEQ